MEVIKKFNLVLKSILPVKHKKMQFCIEQRFVK
jgi:hypothetical protein